MNKKLLACIITLLALCQFSLAQDGAGLPVYFGSDAALSDIMLREAVFKKDVKYKGMKLKVIGLRDIPSGTPNMSTYVYMRNTRGGWLLLAYRAMYWGDLAEIKMQGSSLIILSRVQKTVLMTLPLEPFIEPE